MKLERAYSIMEIKSTEVVDGKRIFKGIASTPSTDRMGDIVEPDGAAFTLPMPFLWQHDSRQPIGWITKVRVVAGKRLEVEGEVHDERQPGKLKDRLDEAWQTLKAGLVRGLSIGFNSLESMRIEGSAYGRRFTKWLWLELSAVTIAANQDATITAIKSVDAELLAMSGRSQSASRGDANSPGVPGNRKALANGGQSGTMKGHAMKTIQEMRAAREQKSARLAELIELKKADDRQFTDDEATEFDDLTDEVKELDDEIRVARFHATNGAAAKPVDGKSTAGASRSRESQPFITSKSNLPKGTAFTRFVIAMANGRGSLSDALKFAERWAKSTPEVIDYIKAVAGTAAGGSDTWGSQLAEPIMQEFVELLMPETIIGKINGFRRVPFNVQIRVQVGGGLVNWVGEGKVKPVGEQAFELFRLGVSKVAGIIVLSDELVRLSTPNAEANVRTDMIKQVAAFLDRQFLDPNVAETADNPASVTNTSTPIPASGVDAAAFRSDMRALRAAFRAANLSTAGSYLVMQGGIADALADMQNALGQPEFPTINSTGGTYRGSTVITSESVPADSSGSLIAMIKPSEILLADDGVTVIDASREATLDMGTSEGATFNLWQRNCVAVKAERWIKWLKARDAAVQYISGAAYDPDAS